MRMFIPRLSYANVIATFALFISLGGASYALVSLPAHSVGSRELKRRAVTAEALDFPLGARLFRDETAHDLTRNACNSPTPPGHAFIGCAPPVFGEGSPLGHVSLAAPGGLLTVAVVSLEYEGAPVTSVAATLGSFVNGRPVDVQSITLTGGQTMQVSLSGLGSGMVGRNRVGIAAAARYNDLGSGDLIVRFARIVAVAVPKLQ